MPFNWRTNIEKKKLSGRLHIRTPDKKKWFLTCETTTKKKFEKKASFHNRNTLWLSMGKFSPEIPSSFTLYTHTNIQHLIAKMLINNFCVITHATNRNISKKKSIGGGFIFSIYSNFQFEYVSASILFLLFYFSILFVVFEMSTLQLSRRWVFSWKCWPIWICSDYLYIRWFALEYLMKKKKKNEKKNKIIGFRESNTYINICVVLFFLLHLYNTYTV